jgi:hypothetical protein
MNNHMSVYSHLKWHRVYLFLLLLYLLDMLFLSLLILLINPFLVESRRIQTKVVILGAGAAGISAAKTLTESNIEDYIIVEAQSFIGGMYI